MLLLPAAFLHSQVYVPLSSSCTFPMYTTFPPGDTSFGLPGWVERGSPAQGKGEQLPLRLPAEQIPTQKLDTAQQKALLAPRRPTAGSTHVVRGEMGLRNRALPSFHQLRVGRGIPWHSQASWTDCPSSTDTASGSAEEKDGGTAGTRGAAQTMASDKRRRGAPHWSSILLDNTPCSSAGCHKKTSDIPLPWLHVETIILSLQPSEGCF